MHYSVLEAYIPYSSCLTLHQITALIVGVVTQLKENVNNQGYLKQLTKLGFLAHFESLLSTYGELEESSIYLRLSHTHPPPPPKKKKENRKRK